MVSLAEMRDGLLSLAKLLQVPMSVQRMQQAVQLLDKSGKGVLNYKEFFHGFRAAGFSAIQTYSADPKHKIEPGTKRVGT